MFNRKFSPKQCDFCLFFGGDGGGQALQHELASNVYC